LLLVQNNRHVRAVGADPKRIVVASRWEISFSPKLVDVVDVQRQVQAWLPKAASFRSAGAIVKIGIGHQKPFDGPELTLSGGSGPFFCQRLVNLR
jgi:hypothetical protein